MDLSVVEMVQVGLGMTLSLLVGMSVGTHFHRRIPPLGGRHQREPETPLPRSRSEDTDELIIEALEAIRAELSDLSERQEFTERLLSQRLEPRRLDEGVSTPV